MLSLGLLLLGGATSAHAATGFNTVGSFAVTAADGTTPNFNQRIAVEASTGNIFEADVVADQVTVYAPSGNSATELTTIGTGELADPFGVAVDQGSGDVYVSDPGNNRIVRYSSDGLPTPTYTRDLTYSGPAQGFGASQIANFAAPIALDPTSGKLLVADRGSSLIKRYNTDGSFDTLVTNGAGAGSSPFAGLQDLAVDSTGDLIVVDSSGGTPEAGGTTRVARFGSDGSFESTIDAPEKAATVAVVPGTDEVVISGNQDAVEDNGTPTVAVYSPAGALVANVTLDSSAQYSTVSGLALNGSGRLYVATDVSRGGYPGQYGQASIQVLDAVTLPTVTTDAASALGGTGATLNGTLNAEGESTTYHFEYGTDTSYGTSTADQGPVSTSTTDPVSQAITGLTPNTTYHYRLVATNANGTSNGEDQTFTTDAVAPTVDGQAANATNIKFNSATLNATVNPNGSQTAFFFEYGTDTTYGNITSPNGDAGAGQTDTQVSAPITGLQPDTTYHFRVVADNGVGGPVQGADHTFTTAPAPPAISNVQVSGVGESTATVTAQIDTGGLAGTYQIAVASTDSAYSQAAPAQTITAGPGATNATASFAGLPAGSGFRVSVQASNASGSSADSGTTFATAGKAPYSAPAPPPADNGDWFGALPTPPAQPSNVFSAKSKVAGTAARVSIGAPGPGALVAKGRYLTSVSKKVSKKGTVALRLKLTKAGAKALKRAKSRRLKVRVTVRFTPTGGSARSATRTLTFKRKARR